MPKTAHAEAGTIWRIGQDSFHFEDGTRQVSEEEAQVLLTAAELGGFKVEITEDKPKPKKETT